MNKQSYVRVDKDSDRKFRYNGFCYKCNENTDHRFAGGSLFKTVFRCMKCKTKNTEEYNYIQHQ